MLLLNVCMGNALVQCAGNNMEEGRSGGGGGGGSEGVCLHSRPALKESMWECSRNVQQVHRALVRQGARLEGGGGGGGDWLGLGFGGRRQHCTGAAAMSGTCSPS